MEITPKKQSHDLREEVIQELEQFPVEVLRALALFLQMRNAPLKP